MVPSSWFTILGFFAFVAPGVSFDLQYSRKQADRRETAFREIGRVVLVSTWCTAWAAAATVLVGHAIRRWVRDSQPYVPTTRDLILGDQSFYANNAAAIALYGAFFIIVALGISRLTFWVMHRNDPGQVTHVSIWRKAFRDDVPPNSHPHVRVRLLNGTSWFGRVAHYSPDLEVADRELVLSPPLALKTASGSIALPDSWGRVVLSGAQIESISVQYRHT